MANVGIKETKELLDFVLSFTQAMQLSLDDGELSWSDTMKFIEPLRKLGPALDDIDDVVAELRDMDEIEFMELVNHVQEHFGIEDQVEEKIEAAVTTGVEIMKLVKMVQI